MSKSPILILSFLSLFLVACNAETSAFNAISGEGNTIRKTLELDPFSAVKLNIAANVTITQGNEQRVEVEAQANIIELISTDINDDTWKITLNKRIRNARPIQIYITVPQLRGAGVSGSGSIVGTNTFTNSQEVNLGISGSGSIKLALEAEAAVAAISGSGDITLRGATSTLSIGISGSGDVDALELISQDVNIGMSGSGDCEVYATRELNAETSGSGDVKYKGQPRVKAHASGSGSIEAI